MSALTDTPTLHFFRATPANLLTQPPLASSLQSLETTFFLLALKRYPSALVSCATAWESVIKAKLGIPPEDRVGLSTLLNNIRDDFPALDRHDREKVREFRETRNRIVHYGFSPKDDRQCGRHLVETGLPFLCSLYRELFDFYVSWRDLQPERVDFMQLNDTELAKAGLIPEVADQLHIISRMHKLNQDRADFDPLFCFTAFSHLVRVGMKEAHKSPAEDTVIERAESIGIRYEVEEAEKQRLELELGCETWEFDCPICSSVRSVVVGLDHDALHRKQVNLTWCVCVSCHLVIPKGAYHLANLLFEKELREQTPKILKEYGLA
jgi:hypothetical protein